MIYICADDYGLCPSVSKHIQECIDSGKLNKVSIFPNFDKIDLHKITEDKSVMLSLHLNLVEGRCMADTSKISLIADKTGNFRHTFIGLLKASIFHKKQFEAQVYEEIRAQALYWKSILPEGAPFCIDSHQHTHMIPSVFRALLAVLKNEKITLSYMRIPAEPILPYIKNPWLYFTYRPVNIIKQWLLKFLWQINKKRASESGISVAYFFGILFSGRMDEKRVNKILPEYIKLAEKRDRDIEVLFHPGYSDADEINGTDKNIIFKEFYLSQNRITEFDSVTKI